VAAIVLVVVVVVVVVEISQALKSTRGLGMKGYFDLYWYLRQLQGIFTFAMPLPPV